MIVSLPIATAYMETYYTRNMIHVTYIWVLKILNMGVFIKYGYGFEEGMGGSTLILKVLRVFFIKTASNNPYSKQGRFCKLGVSFSTSKCKIL
jgi:hypothetical protein